MIMFVLGALALLPRARTPGFILYAAERVYVLEGRPNFGGLGLGRIKHTLTFGNYL